MNEGKTQNQEPQSQTLLPVEKPLVDLEGLEPPGSIEETRIEEITIDGICGVY